MLDVMRAVADAIGLDYRKRKVVGFSVHCQLGEVPKVVVHELLLKASGVQRATCHMTLQPLQAEQQGIEQQCNAALQRVQGFIDERAGEILASLRRRPRGGA